MTKISKELAEKEFMRFIDALDLAADNEMSREVEEDSAVLANKETVATALQRGFLVVDDAGLLIFTPQRSEDRTPITFYEPTGASLMAMDSAKKSEDVKRLFQVMADITRRDAKTFAAMKMADLKICMAITTLFLA